MRPFATTPAADCYAALPQADFADAFSLDLPGPLDAPQATQRAFSAMPGWVSALLRLRNLVVAPLGLRTAADATLPAGQRFGMFPVVSSDADRVVLGFDDSHLDFRIVVDVRDQATGRRVTLTTLVRRNAWLGRIYLAVVMPFHKIIVPTMLARLAPR